MLWLVNRIWIAVINQITFLYHPTSSPKIYTFTHTHHRQLGKYTETKDTWIIKDTTTKNDTENAQTVGKIHRQFKNLSSRPDTVWEIAQTVEKMHRQSGNWFSRPDTVWEIAETVKKMHRQSGNLFGKQNTVWEIAQAMRKKQTVWKLV
jgi:hypothetical protein